MLFKFSISSHDIAQLEIIFVGGRAKLLKLTMEQIKHLANEGVLEAFNEIPWEINLRCYLALLN